MNTKAVNLPVLALGALLGTLVMVLLMIQPHVTHNDLASAQTSQVPYVTPTQVYSATCIQPQVAVPSSNTPVAGSPNTSLPGIPNTGASQSPAPGIPFNPQTCPIGYKMISNVCQQVVAPPNAYVYGSDWNCNPGYQIQFDAMMNKIGCVPAF